MQMQMFSIRDTTGHIPKHQQLGILEHAWKSKTSLGHLPWSSNGVIAKVKFFKSLDNIRKKLTMEGEYYS
jgi:hypothetical protein